MKLSEILGWSKKLKGGELDKDHCFGFNTALDSCDREIDREALEDILCHHAPMLRSEANDISHAIISNMPTWLKRSEGE